MVPPRRKLPLILLVACIFAGTWLLIPSYMTFRLKSVLQAQGFTTVSVGKAHLGFNGMTFTDIKLDKEGNSMIARVETPVSFGWPDDIYMSGLVLSGDMGADGLPVIDGWRRQGIQFPDAIKTVEIENGKLDLTTPAGGITVTFQGQMTASDRKSRQFLAVFNGNQNQLTFDMRTTATWSDNDKWQMRGEIGDLRMRLDHFSTSRTAGWITLHDDKPDAGRHGVPVAMDGKLTSGLVFLGPAALHDVGTTFSLSPKALNVTFEASPGDPPTMRLKAGLQRSESGAVVQASLRSKSLADIFSFLQSVRSGVDVNPVFVNKPLASLLLTQGNLDRIGQQFQGQPYDNVVLSLTGPLQSLQGKVTAEIPSPTGGIARQTVDFDPAVTP